MSSSYYFDAVMHDNPIAYYQMNRSDSSLDDLFPPPSQTASGLPLVDSASHIYAGRHGSMLGNEPVESPLPLVSGSESGIAIGQNNMITIPALEIWEKSRETYGFSIELWFKQFSYGQDNAVLLRPRGVDGNYISLSNGTITFRMSNTFNGQALSLDTIITHQLSEPLMGHHLVATYNNGSMKLYIDGVLVGEASATYRVAWDFFNVGFEILGPNNDYIVIDSYSFYKHQLSLASILRHYAMGRSTVGSQEIAQKTSAMFFPIDDTDSYGILDVDWPQDSKFTPYSASKNVESGTSIGLIEVTSPDSVDDNVLFTGGSFQSIPGEKLLSDEMSTMRAINILENASFDVDVNADGVPDRWTALNTAAGSVNLVDDAVSSQYSVNLVMTGAANGLLVGIQSSKVTIHESIVNNPNDSAYELPTEVPAAGSSVDINPPKGYTISFDAKGIFTNSAFKVVIDQWKGGVQLPSITNHIQVSSTWNRHQLSFQTTSGVNEISVSLQAVSAGAGSAIVTVDNVMLEEGQYSGMYVDGWFRYTSAGTLPIMTKSNIYDTGVGSVKIESTYASSSVGLMSERLPVDPADLMYARFSYMTNTSITNGKAKIAWTYYNEAGSEIATYNDEYSLVTGQWTPIYSISEAPVGAYTFTAAFCISSVNNVPVGFEVNVDNIYINELIDEAAQYLVVEELDKVTSADEGGLRLEFFLSKIHKMRGDYTILSIDEGDLGIQLVKTKIDANDVIVIRYIYTENGTPKYLDKVLKQLVTNNYDKWMTCILSWRGDTFDATIDNVLIETIDTGDYTTFQVSYNSELTLGAGLNGLNGWGAGLRNLRIYDAKPESGEFASPTTTNYILPLNDNLDISMTGYAVFRFDLTGIYEAIDDIKVEWGPNNSHITVLGGISLDQLNELRSGGEPTPLTGGYCPSSIAQVYYIKVVFDTDDVVYYPAKMKYFSFTILDDVKFKSKTNNSVIYPNGSFTVNSRSTQIINQFDSNGVSFKPTTSNNMLINGGFLYNTDGWFNNNLYGLAKLSRSVEEYYSGGSCLRIDPIDTKFELVNYQTPSANLVKVGWDDLGTAGTYRTNCSVEKTHGVSNSQGYVVSKTSNGQDVEVGTSRSIRIPVSANMEYVASVNVVNATEKPLMICVDEYNSSNTLIASHSYDSAASGNIYKTFTSSATAVSAVVYIKQLDSSGWLSGEVFTFSNVCLRAGNNFADIYDEPYVRNSVYQYDVEVNANRVYTLSFMVMSSATGTISANIDYYKPDGTFISTTSGASKPLQSGWTQYSISSNSPSTAGFARVRIVGKVSDLSPVYIDQIQLEYGNFVTQYSDNVPSYARLETDKTWTKLSTNDAGSPITGPDQSRIGAIEFWACIDEEVSKNLAEVNGDNLTSATTLGSVVKIPGVLHDGLYWTSLGCTATSGIRITAPLEDLEDFDHVCSIEVYNPTPNPAQVRVSWCDVSDTIETVLPYQKKVISTIGDKTNYSAIKRYFDVQMTIAGTIYVRRPFIERSLPASGPSKRRLTLLEKGNSGLYYDVDGFVTRNMKHCYIDGQLHSNMKYVRNKWTHFVAIPSETAYRVNYIKNPEFNDTSWWYAATDTTRVVNYDPNPESTNNLVVAWSGASKATNFACNVTHAISGLSDGPHTFSLFSKSSNSTEKLIINISFMNSSDVVKATSVFYTNSLSEAWAKDIFYMNVPSGFGIVKGIVTIGANCDPGDSFMIAAPMLCNTAYSVPFFYYGSGQDVKTSSDGSVVSLFIPDQNCSPHTTGHNSWCFAGSRIGLGQVKCSISNIIAHPREIYQIAINDNFKANLSRGNIIVAGDKFTTKSGLSGVPAFRDGMPLAISAPWSVQTGSA